METTTINHNGVNFEIGYHIDGKYVPATHYEPEEFAEIQLMSIKIEDSETDLLDWMPFELQEEIELLIQEQNEI